MRRGERGRNSSFAAMSWDGMGRFLQQMQSRWRRKCPELRTKKDSGLELAGILTVPLSCFLFFSESDSRGAWFSPKSKLMLAS